MNASLIRDELRSSFLESAIKGFIRALTTTKTELEEAAPGSVLYKTALEIIEEFMTCMEFREQLRVHKAAQRRLLTNNWDRYFETLVLQDGKQCAHCKSKRKEARN